MAYYNGVLGVKYVFLTVQQRQQRCSTTILYRRRMEYLEPLHVYALLGTPPSSDHLRALRHAFPVQFRQVVALSSHTSALVQLCNFIRRCRKEKQAGTAFHYLVLLQYLPHREAHHLLHVAHDLNITVIAYGGVCIDRAIGSLFAGSARGHPRALLEWTGNVVAQRPVVCAYWMHARRPFLVRCLDGIETFGDDDDPQRYLQPWIESRAPSTWTSTTFATATHSATHSARAPSTASTFSTGSSSGSSYTPPPNPPPPATSTMNIRLACSLLGILEHQSTCVATVRKAYRRRAIALHPDKRRTDSERREATDAFAKLNEAKRYLDSLLES